MRKLLLGMLMVIVVFSLIITNAEARRFGGGKSFGMQRSSVSRIQPAPTVTAAKPVNSANRWLAPLAGLAIGGLLASLFMGHGLGTGILSWLLIGGAVLLIWNLIRNRMQPASITQPLQQKMGFHQIRPGQSFATTPLNCTPYKNNMAVPNFDEAAFLRLAKSLFIRLQASYDVKNLADIREFTTPEVYAEIQLQTQELGDTENITEVISINADLLDAVAEYRATIATVRFTGLIREEVGAEPVAINELWHFRKDDFKPNWAVAGIEQQ